MTLTGRYALSLLCQSRSIAGKHYVIKSRRW